MGSSAARRPGDLALGLTIADQTGLEDFWRVYDANLDQIERETRKLLADDPDFGVIIQSMSEQQAQEQSRESREWLRQAIEDRNWEGYEDYLRDQGSIYARMGLSFASWFRVLNVFRPRVTELLLEEYGQTPDRFRGATDAMNAFMDGAMALIGEEYLRAKESIISEQAEAIRELSTPVLQIREGLLLLPLVGVIDSHRARQMTDQLLRAIRGNRARVVVIDITGVPAVDSMVANHLIQLIEATRLLGASAILTGLSPEVAQTLVKIGVDLGNVRTSGNLQDGVEEANRITGYRLVPGGGAAQ